MRISSEERAVIIEEIAKMDRDALVYLFGSRADDSAKGG
jgi:predicted nucleotidyltransferase